MADPDLQIMGEGGHPDPEIRGRGRGRSQKNFVRFFGLQFGPKIKGAPLPSIRHCCNLFTHGKPLQAKSLYVGDRVGI